MAQHTPGQPQGRAPKGYPINAWVSDLPEPRLVQFQYRHKCLLRHIHRTDCLQALFTFGLFLQ